MKAMKKFQNNKMIIAVLFFVMIVIAVFTENSVDSMASHFQMKNIFGTDIDAEQTLKEKFIDEKYTLDQKVPTGFISVEKQEFRRMPAFSIRKLYPFERRELSVCFASILSILFKIALIPGFIFILLFTITCSFFYAGSRLLRCMYKRDGKKEAVFIF